MKRIVISTVIILSLILIGTTIGIFYARGYRFDPTNPKGILEGTGLLVLTSKPDGSRVFINDHLTTATNNTINLAPGIYQVRIEQDGYFPWKKTIEIKTEAVSQANATLFPIAPRLESITATGALNPTLDGSGSIIAYTVASASADKNGIYTLNMSAPAILPLGGGANQITNDLLAQFSSSHLAFSPDGTQLLASVSANLAFPNSYLLSARSFNSNPKDVTATLPQVLADWEKQTQLKNKKIIDSLPRKVRTIAQTNFGNPVVSPMDDKILYTASQSATLPLLINPRLPGTDSTPEVRNITKGNIYVYDMKEDRNYLLAKNEEEAKFLWLPDSAHLAYVKGSKINIIEYDGQNITTVYAGPFVDNFVFPWPDGSSLVILTNLNIPDAPNNLYRISLR